ncbi:MAG: flagellar motor switch phosphatase FliY [Anaerotruncus sp.]|nr:flagellar motor switch phosphatase FliY [Anaerotruncus sp.]
MVQKEAQESESLLSSLEIDTIGEILNISMGSSATAISSLLDRQVIISTPTVTLRQFHSLDYSMMEPAVLVKIQYVEGISGNNVMIFRQRDMQIILNLLMGNDEEPSDDFVFDELSMSAACEVMNQMMGAAATALSQFLNRVVNISTPVASVVDSEGSYREAVGVQEGDEIVAVSFHIVIDGVMDSDFVSIMTCELVRDMVNQVMGQQEEEISSIETVPEPMPAPAPAPAPTPAPAAPAPTPAATPAPAPAPAPAAPQQPQQPQQMPPQPGVPGMAPPPAGYPQPPQGGEMAGGYPPYGQMPPYGYPPYGYYPMPPYPGYGVPPEQQAAAPRPQVNVQNTQFPQFTMQQTDSPATGANMDLLMGVSLDVTVEIGQAKRKIKDILDFGQGTVIELNKQAGAPVDIVVNGRLLARGDVVVIDDNFGVRITEIVGTKELLESLKENMG